MCTCKILEKHGLNPTWYSIECTNNSGQKKFYSFAMANDNAAIQYAENVLCPNSITEEIMSDDIKNLMTFLEPNTNDLDYPPPTKLSFSFLQANPSVYVGPQIEITEPQIYINHSTNCGSSKITGTTLSGSGGNYFLQNGGYIVTPGIYIHRIQGTINGYDHCEIRSQLNYA